MEEVVKAFEREGVLLTTHALEQLKRNKVDPKELVQKSKEAGIWLITEEFIVEFLTKGREREREVVVLREGKKVPAKDVEAEVKVLERTEVTGKSSCEGFIEDFVECFRDRFERLSSILRQREALRNALPVKLVKRYQNERVSVIGIVRDKRETKRGHKIVELEDPSGELSVLVPRSDEGLSSAYESLLLDEVVGVSGFVRGDLLIASSFERPELPIDHQPKKLDFPISAAFLSDLHIGSYLFLEKEFEAFLSSLRLERGEEELFGSVKYLLIAGDLVDGVGIYPQQENELSIPDVYKQYDYLAGLLAMLPDWVEVIISVGNHDAVRLAEPQPALPKEVAGELAELPNVHLVGNPVVVSLSGVKFLIYHGASLDSIIGNLSNCTYARPEVAMIECLRRRHLSPSYGDHLISPERRDYLVIEPVPDVFHAGHVHRNGYSVYRGVTVVNSGTWQARTRYQEELGHIPTPCKLPILNLQSYELLTIDYS